MTIKLLNLDKTNKLDFIVYILEMNKNFKLKNVKFIYKGKIIKLSYKILLLQMPSFFRLKILLFAGETIKLLHDPLMRLLKIIVVYKMTAKS